jgi:hypothetical protein
MNLLYHSIAKGSQHTLAEWAYGFGERRLRLRIRSDNCDFQSYAHAEMWDEQGTQWRPVASVHYGEMKTPVAMYADRAGWNNVSVYKADHDELLRRATLIVPGLGRDDDARLGSWYIVVSAEGDYLYIHRDDRPGAINVKADDEGFVVDVWDSDSANSVATCAAFYNDLDSNLERDDKAGN